MSTDNRKGIHLMVLSMACFISNDALVKFVSQSLPSGTIILVRGLMASALVLLALRFTGTPVPARQLLDRRVLTRAGIDGLATFAYLLSLFQLPLANATAINMATPLVITLLAVLWLREQVMPRQWGAIAAGFVGVLLVIQPRAEGFNAFAWLCLLGTVLHALRDLLTRRIASEVPSLVITLATAVVVTAMAGLLCLVQGWQTPSPSQGAMLAAAAAFLASGNQKGRILKLEAGATDLRNDVADRDRRIDFLENANERGKVLSEAKDLEMHSLRQQMEALGQVIRGEAEFAALRDHLDDMRDHLDEKFVHTDTKFSESLARLERAIMKEQA